MVLPAHAGMVPPTAHCRNSTARAPRARGDGPVVAQVLGVQGECSPRTRGWSPRPPPLPAAPGVLPAHAGMVPCRSAKNTSKTCAPRARGDGPGIAPTEIQIGACSPRTRGWSPHPCRPLRRGPVLPAHAGMVPLRSFSKDPFYSAPRARGDGPSTERDCCKWQPCSPRTRGWSPRRPSAPFPVRVLPAHAGMVRICSPSPGVGPCAPRARGDGPEQLDEPPGDLVCSPRTRGWSLGQAATGSPGPVLPAHAGMVPPGAARGLPHPRAPRARGDGPYAAVLRRIQQLCSPRTRGWSLPAAAIPFHRPVLPAHAGMVPSAGAVPAPRTRGWSPLDQQVTNPGAVLPAHAGMVPAGSTSGTAMACAPRARGDGPETRKAPSERRKCSPRTRGWSQS